MPPFVLHTVYPRTLFDNMQNAQGVNPYLAAENAVKDHGNKTAPFSFRQYQAWGNLSRKATMTMIERHAASSLFQAQSAAAIVQLLASLHDFRPVPPLDADVALRIAANFAVTKDVQCSVVLYSDIVLVTSFIFLS